MAAERRQLVSDEESALLTLLRDGAPRTRSQLCAETGLARSTVANRLGGLMSSGLVVTGADAESSGGRPASRVMFNPSARIIVAVDLGATHGVVAVADLAGHILASDAQPLQIGTGPEPILDWVVSTAARLLARAGRAASDLVGVGIGVPGPVEHSTGRPFNPPIMPGWDRFDVPAYVQRVFDVPVFVDNDVNILAIGEHATAWRDADNLLFIKVATGIGAGIISGGRLQRGAQGSAGDIGHVLVPGVDPGRDAPGGSAGRDLEQRASGSALAGDLHRRGYPTASTADVVTLIRAGNTDALAALRQAGRDVGEVLATCVNLLNPSVVVIGGSLARAAEGLLAGVREVVYGRSTPLATEQLRIVPAQAGANGGVIGAAIMVAQYVLDPALSAR